MMPNARELLEAAEEFQNLLVLRAVGGVVDPDRYVELRELLMSDPRIKTKLPRFVRTCRDIYQYWQYIKYKHDTYAARRKYVWDEFRPVLEELEHGSSPAERDVAEALSSFSTEEVQRVWEQAVSRLTTDDRGAITSARTLLESVCKHILDESDVSYDDESDLPKLYKLVSQYLDIAPSQQTHAIFRQVLGGCAAVVEGLGAVRNKLGDPHGRGTGDPRPATRHARLTVNLAGAMAIFLCETWQSRNSRRTKI